MGVCIVGFQARSTFHQAGCHHRSYLFNDHYRLGSVARSQIAYDFISHPCIVGIIIPLSATTKDYVRLTTDAIDTVPEYASPLTVERVRHDWHYSDWEQLRVTTIL